MICAADDVTYVYDDVTYVYDDVTYVYDDVTYDIWWCANVTQQRERPPSCIFLYMYILHFVCMSYKALYIYCIYIGVK